LYNNTNWRSYTSVYDYGTSQNGYLHIYSVTAGADVAPTSITLGSYSTTMTAGTNQSITATMTPASTTEKVVWASSDNTILSLSDSGTTGGVSTAVVTPIGNGTATITAHAFTTTTVTITTSTITVSGFSTDTAPRTLVPTNFGFGTSYSSGNKTVNGIVYGYSDLMTPASDSTYSGVTTYNKGTFQFKATTGTLWTLSKYAAKISKVLVSAIASTTNITVVGGAETKSTSVSSTVTNNGKFYTYVFSTSVDFVTIGNGGNASYINSATIELSGGVETVATLADYINGIQVDRSDDLAVCTGTTGNYVAAKTRYFASSDTVQGDFKTSTDTTVATARTRYLQWAARYGDTTPYAPTYGSAAKVSLATNNNNLAFIISVLALVAFGSFLFLAKKKKHNA